MHIHIYMYIYILASIFPYVSIHIPVYINMCMYISICIHTYIYIHMYIYMSLPINIRKKKHVYIYLSHVCTNIFVYMSFTKRSVVSEKGLRWGPLPVCTLQRSGAFMNAVDLPQGTLQRPPLRVQLLVAL